jgi:hypothetical protein
MLIPYLLKLILNGRKVLNRISECASSAPIPKESKFALILTQMKAFTAKNSAHKPNTSHENILFKDCFLNCGKFIGIYHQTGKSNPYKLR